MPQGRPRLAAVLDLPGDGGAAGLGQQRAGQAAEQQPGHQVLEHRAAPGDQADASGGADERAAELEPVAARGLAPRDGQVAGQAALRGQQVIAGVVQPAVHQVVADGEEVAIGAIERAEVHAVGHRVGRVGQAAEPAQELGRPGVAHGRRRSRAGSRRRPGSAASAARAASSAARRSARSTIADEARRGQQGLADRGPGVGRRPPRTNRGPPRPDELSQTLSHGATAFSSARHVDGLLDQPVGPGRRDGAASGLGRPASVRAPPLDRLQPGAPLRSRLPGGDRAKARHSRRADSSARPDSVARPNASASPWTTAGPTHRRLGLLPQAVRQRDAGSPAGCRCPPSRCTAAAAAGASGSRTSCRSGPSASPVRSSVSKVFSSRSTIRRGPM